MTWLLVRLCLMALFAALSLACGYFACQAWPGRAEMRAMGRWERGRRT